MAEERIQKILSRAGFGSRRECEEYLKAGRVTVNGIKAGLGDKADSTKDQVWLDGKPVSSTTEFIYIALHKPRQVLSAIHQDDDRRDVLDLVKIDAHLFPVGRLDYDSEGLLLLTNDGEFANRLSHPRYEHEKEYIVTVGSRPDEDQLTTWRRGVVLEDGYRTAPCRVDIIETQPKGAVLRVILKEGRKRQIRESGERIGLPVQRIKRVRIGTILLGNLKPGEWRNLTKQEVTSMEKVELKRSGPPAHRTGNGMARTASSRRPVSKTGFRPSSGEHEGERTNSTAKPRRSYSRSEGEFQPESSAGSDRPARRTSSTRPGGYRSERSSGGSDYPRRSDGGEGAPEYTSNSDRPRRSSSSRPSNAPSRGGYRSERSSGSDYPRRSESSEGSSDYSSNSDRPRRSSSSRPSNAPSRGGYRSERSSGSDYPRRSDGGEGAPEYNSNSDRPRRSSSSRPSNTPSRGGFRSERSTGSDYPRRSEGGEGSSDYNSNSDRPRRSSSSRPSNAPLRGGYRSERSSDGSDAPRRTEGGERSPNVTSTSDRPRRTSNSRPGGSSSSGPRRSGGNSSKPRGGGSRSSGGRSNHNS